MDISSVAFKKSFVVAPLAAMLAGMVIAKYRHLFFYLPHGHMLYVLTGGKFASQDF